MGSSRRRKYDITKMSKEQKTQYKFEDSDDMKSSSDSGSDSSSDSDSDID